MSLKKFLEELDGEVKSVLAPGFNVEIVDTETVPTLDDPDITYDNLDSGTKRCKRLESCVLYIDIRNSAAISAEKKPVTLSRMYSTFVRSMIRCARYYGGHVRNIIGDRVMVVYDRKDCFSNAVSTAILMNTVSQYVIDRRFTYGEFRCGIGIDYGKMLVTKGGAIRHGSETEFYRSLVWLGQPANVASRLTDLANKTLTTYKAGVRVGLHYPNIDEWSWIDIPTADFLDELQTTYSPVLKHTNEHFNTFYKTTLGPYSSTHKQIFMTEAVYAGLKRDKPGVDHVVNNWWTEQNIKIDVYKGAVYGGNVYYLAGEELQP